MQVDTNTSDHSAAAEMLLQLAETGTTISQKEAADLKKRNAELEQKVGDMGRVEEELRRVREELKTERARRPSNDDEKQQKREAR